MVQFQDIVLEWFAKHTPNTASSPVPVAMPRLWRGNANSIAIITCHRQKQTSQQLCAG